MEALAQARCLGLACWGKERWGAGREADGVGLYRVEEGVVARRLNGAVEEAGGAEGGGVLVHILEILFREGTERRVCGREIWEGKKRGEAEARAGPRRFTC